MRILFIGGANFVGRHIADAVIAAGHTVTFFNRGVTDDALFPGHARLCGDRARAENLVQLETIAADLVIDSCGYTPDEVVASARAVASWAKRYVFISSVDALDLSVRRGRSVRRPMANSMAYTKRSASATSWRS